MVIENTALAHALRQHGDAALEAKRGQAAITRDDLQHIPEIMLTGSPSLAGANKRGTTTIEFRKSIGSNDYVVGADVRGSARQLAFKTMRKKAAG